MYISVEVEAVELVVLEVVAAVMVSVVSDLEAAEGAGRKHGFPLQHQLPVLEKRRRRRRRLPVPLVAAAAGAPAKGRGFRRWYPRHPAKDQKREDKQHLQMREAG